MNSIHKYLVGVGNWAMGDDSIGLRIVEYISENGLEKDFEAIDLSGSGLRLLNYFVPETERILVVDTVFGEKEPGEVFHFCPDDVLSEKQLSQFTTHESDLLKTIHMGKELGYFIPKIKVMGIQPLTTENKMELSTPLQSRFQGYVEEAISRLLSPEF